MQLWVENLIWSGFHIFSWHLQSDAHFCHTAVFGEMPANAWSTQEARSEHDGCLADLLWLALACVSTQTAFLLRAAAASPRSLCVEFAFDNDQ